MKGGKAIEDSTKKAKDALTTGATNTKVANADSKTNSQQINQANNQANVQNMFKLSSSYDYFGSTVFKSGINMIYGVDLYF